jgi:hypothetical protein
MTTSNTVQECPAHGVCSKANDGPDCDICRQLSIASWKEHVRGVLAKARVSF